MRQAQQELEAFVAERQARRQAAAEQQRAHEVRRRMQPRTPADFVLLYDELAMWWGQEQEKIAAAESVTGGQAGWVGSRKGSGHPEYHHGMALHAAMVHSPTPAYLLTCLTCPPLSPHR
jgi:hypothetical protein